MKSNRVYDELLEVSREIHTLTSARDILEWDQETNMPPKGVELRSRQLAILSGLIHDLLIGDRMAALIGIAAEPRRSR